MSHDGSIKEVVKAPVAHQAGVVAGGKVIAVNGRKWSALTLRSAISNSGTKPIELLIERRDHFHTYQLSYRGGERYPTLVRDELVSD